MASGTSDPRCALVGHAAEMPRVSSRQKELREVRHKLQLNIALESSGSSSNSGSVDTFVGDSQSNRVLTGSCASSNSSSNLSLNSSSDSESGEDSIELEAKPGNLFKLYFVLYNTRYFVSRHISSKSSEFVTQYFHNLPEKLFRQLTRMDKQTFRHLLDLIEDHPVFQSNSNHEQAPVIRQLAVCLDRIGHHGNGACLNHLIPIWGVSIGSLCNFSKRCFPALEDVLADQIAWPDRNERAQISQHFGQHGFDGCVGLIDGSLLPLTQWPKRDGECYYDRKSRYSISAQVVCDQERKIRYLFADLTCLKRSPSWQFVNIVGKNAMFDEGQYLLGDSRYQALPHLVCAFKRVDIVPDKEDFNTCVAKCRVTNEHCIGVLKSLWHSLKEVRVQLNQKKDNVWVVRWISLAAKLHNYVISRNDIWTDKDQEENREGMDPTNEAGPEEPTVKNSRRGMAAVGNALLVRVMDETLAFNHELGQFLI